MATKQLTAVDRTDLRKCEKQIEAGIHSVGSALCTIRDKKLYREKHKTFEAYCQGRWGFTKRYANMQITACETGQHLGTIVPKTEVPKKESQLREIAKAPKEIQAEVLKAGNEKAKSEGRAPVAKDYREARKEICQEPKPNPPNLTKPSQPDVTGSDLAHAITTAKQIVKSDFCPDFVKAIKRALKAKGYEVIKQVKGLTVEMVEAYASEYAATEAARKKSWPLSPFDADAFFDYYSAQGWKLSNGNAMVDWQSAVRQWGRRSQSGGGGKSAFEQAISVDF